MRTTEGHVGVGSVVSYTIEPGPRTGRAHEAVLPPVAAAPPRARRAEAQGHTRGLEIQTESATNFAIRDGTVVEARGYVDRSTALEPAGLS